MQFYFLTQKILHTQKAQKAQNANKRLSLRRFLQVQKAQNVKQAIFFFLDVSYAHKNAVFFALHTKKSTKKHIKSTKTHIGEQATFFPLDVFFKRI